MALVNPTIKPITKKNEKTRSVKKKEEPKRTLVSKPTASRKPTKVVVITAKKNTKQTMFASLNFIKGKTKTKVYKSSRK